MQQLLGNAACGFAVADQPGNLTEGEPLLVNRLGLQLRLVTRRRGNVGARSGAIDRGTIATAEDASQNNNAKHDPTTHSAPSSFEKSSALIANG